MAGEPGLVCSGGPWLAWGGGLGMTLGSRPRLACGRGPWLAWGGGPGRCVVRPCSLVVSGSCLHHIYCKIALNGRNIAVYGLIRQGTRLSRQEAVQLICFDREHRPAVIGTQSCVGGKWEFQQCSNISLMHGVFKAVVDLNRRNHTRRASNNAGW